TICFLFGHYSDHPRLPSFPTRRSSDLNSVAVVVASFPDSRRISSGGYLLVDSVPVQETDVAKDPQRPIKESYIPGVIQKQSKNRSEEHTSELQSRENLVCRLLLEKKKN